ALMALENMNEAIAKRILSYRRKLGGFMEDNQLYDVYGIKASQVRSIKAVYTVLSKPEIVMIEVNKANASDLSTIPFVTFDIARDIIDYRTLHGAITNLDDLLKIDGITAYKLERIKLYLSTNQN
ncbi:MAG: helix-hairpin-helix domain-containing protein, partial [Bacteroidota bacterium]|nr:helix-hairpin-helix domain-containing protein [Bacteroidota bacterium]